MNQNNNTLKNKLADKLVTSFIRLSSTYCSVTEVPSRGHNTSFNNDAFYSLYPNLCDGVRILRVKLLILIINSDVESLKFFEIKLNIYFKIAQEIL